MTSFASFLLRAAGWALPTGVALAAIGTGVAACHTPAPMTVGDASASDGGSLLASEGSSSAPPLGDAGDDGGVHRFEGQVDMLLRFAEADTEKAADVKGTDRYIFKVKGDAFRWDLYENSVPRGDYRIYDRSAHRFYTVLKSGGVILATPESPALTLDPAASFVLENLNETGRVLGHSCDRYRTRGGNKRYEICATDAIMAFPFQMMPGDMQTTVPFGLELQHRNMFPLLVNEFEEPDGGAPPAKLDGGLLPGKLVASLRVVNIEERPIDNADFDLPKYPVTRTQKLQTTVHKTLR